MAVGEDVAVAADSTERKGLPTAVLYNAVQGARNIALHAHSDGGHAARGCRQTLRFCTALEPAASFACLLPGTRRDQCRPGQGDVGQLVVAVHIFHRALTNRFLNPVY